LTSLAGVLQSAATASPELDIAQVARLLFAADCFRRDPDYLAAALDGMAVPPLALVVDQFEELFTLGADAEARAAFVTQLLGLVHDADHPHRVILTMRTDFVDSVAKAPDLFPLFRAGRVDVEALDINELRAAIEGPAARVGLRFEEGIVDDLVTTILGERAGLPLLQFTLLRLWEKRQRNRVTREVYREVGNPREALERAAESFYESLIPEEQETAKRILLRMIQLGEGREVTSKRIRRDDVFREGEARDRVEHVLDRLIREARLVKLTGGESGTDAQIEVAHEALVRNWRQLGDWLEAKREIDRKRWRLKDAAQQWERTGRDVGALWRGALLEESLRYSDLNELEQEFVAASQAELETAEREREAARQRELAQAHALAEEQRRRADEQARSARQLRRLLIALAAVFVLALSASGVALVQQQQVSNAQATAQAETIARSASDYQAAARALEAAAANATAVVAQLVAKGSLATQEANIVSLIDPPGVTRTRSVMYTDTPAAPRTSTPTPTRGILAPSRPVVTQRPTGTATPGIPATATVVALQTQLNAVRATQTALAGSQNLYAIIPDIDIAIRSQPSAGADVLETVQVPEKLRVLRVDEGKWVEVQTSKGTRGWVFGYSLVYEGNLNLLPNELRYRLISDRSDLPFIYGKVVSHDGVRKIYSLNVHPEDNTDIVMNVPVHTNVIILLKMNGSKAFGSGVWYLVAVVESGGTNQLWHGYLPAEAIAER
jgi:hypothetical protein